MSFESLIPVMLTTYNFKQFYIKVASPKHEMLLHQERFIYFKLVQPFDRNMIYSSLTYRESVISSDVKWSEVISLNIRFR